jgi:ABC-type multidrug transport system fused ATPase/permease subunit
MLYTVRQTLGLFERRERWQLVRVFASMVFMAIMETIGVASVMPFLTLVSRPELIHSHPRVAWIYDWLGFESDRQFLLATGAGVLVAIAVSNLLTAYLTWSTLRFIWHKSHELSERLLARYLDEPYAFYLDRNTATLSTNLLSEVEAVLTGVLVPGMLVLAKGLVVALIFGLLVVLDPVLAASAAVVLGGAYAGIHGLYRKRQAHWGKRKILANRLRFKVAGEAFGGIKEVKVLGREREFLRRFRGPSEEYARANASNAIAGQLPRFGVETVAFGGILVTMLYLLQTRQGITEILPMLGIFAVAGYRLMPALQQIFLGVARIRFSMAALEGLYEDLNRPRTPGPAGEATASGPVAPLPFEREIRVEGLVFSYPASPAPVLKGIDLVLGKNRTYGMVGSTGSGKTTLADLLLGLFDPDEGRITVDGVPLTAANRASWRRILGYVPQHIFLSDDTVARNIALGLPEEDVDMRAVERASRIAQLHDFVAGLPDGYETVVGERGVRLSGGQRQRIGIARALYHDPEILVMDEATSALDNVTESAVMQAIRRLAGRKTIILIAHRLTTVERCDRIFMLRNGRLLAEGSFDELLQESPEFAALATSTAHEETETFA